MEMNENSYPEVKKATSLEDPIIYPGEGTILVYGWTLNKA
jgi:hypothetical protein